MSVKTNVVRCKLNFHLKVKVSVYPVSWIWFLEATFTEEPVIGRGLASALYWSASPVHLEAPGGGPSPPDDPL